MVMQITGTFHDWSLTLYGTEVPAQTGLDPPSEDISSQSLQELEPAPAAGAENARRREVDFSPRRQASWAVPEPAQGATNGAGAGAGRVTVCCGVCHKFSSFSSLLAIFLVLAGHFSTI